MPQVRILSSRSSQTLLPLKIWVRSRPDGERPSDIAMELPVVPFVITVVCVIGYVYPDGLPSRS